MQDGSPRTNQARSDATRAALIAAARKAFVERGYAATGTPDIVESAGLTRGALYHHFADKEALFRAVVEAESAAVAKEIELAPPAGASPVDALIVGGEAFLAAMARHGRTRLLLVDAPAVLGRAVIDEIDARHGARTLRDGLRAAMQAGRLRRLPLDVTAQLLSSAFDRAALSLENGGDPAAWRDALRALIEGLARPCGQAGQLGD